MASLVYCADEQTQQNHRTRTRPNRLMVSLVYFLGSEMRDVEINGEACTQTGDEMVPKFRTGA
jgi:hypothetical protein